MTQDDIRISKQFCKFCVRVLQNEAVNIEAELARQRKREKSLNVLTNDEIPRHTIDGAISGNAEDLAFILGYFSGYIKKLATRTLKDEYGNEYLYVDEDMRLRLESKLMKSIVSDFEIRR